MSKLRRRLFLAFLLLAVAAIPATIPGCENPNEPQSCAGMSEICIVVDGKGYGCCPGLVCLHGRCD
jgi:hypothetical protein